MRLDVKLVLLFLGTFAFPGISGVASDALLVFVGEKIEVKEFTPRVCDGCVALDQAFHAKYRILKVVYGEYSGRTIEFDAFDHYGFPPFASFQHALLFVSKAKDGTLYHEKYQFFPVYRTATGEWAGCGPPYQHEPKAHRGSIEAHPIDFSPEVSFPISGLSAEKRAERFPAGYYSISNERAVCLKGNSLSELFEVKKNGILRARGVIK